MLLRTIPYLIRLKLRILLNPKRDGFLGSFFTRYRVPFYEFALTPSRYINYLDFSRVEFMMRSGLMKLGKEKGFFSFMSSNLIFHHQDLNWLDSFRLTYQPIFITDKFIYCRFQFIRSGTVVSEGFDTIAMYSRKEGFLKPENVIRELGYGGGFEKPHAQIVELMEGVG